MQGRPHKLARQWPQALLYKRAFQLAKTAEHEHIPEIAAAALGQYLLNQQHGPEKIRDMIRDDIHSALARNDRMLVAGLSIIRVHNLWVADWRVIITLAGWFSVIGGLVRMLMPA